MFVIGLHNNSTLKTPKKDKCLPTSFLGHKLPKTTIKNVCCYCNQTRNLSRVRDFYVCKKHLAAWGIA